MKASLENSNYNDKQYIIYQQNALSLNKLIIWKQHSEKI